MVIFLQPHLKMEFLYSYSMSVFPQDGLKVTKWLIQLKPFTTSPRCSMVQEPITMQLPGMVRR